MTSNFCRAMLCISARGLCRHAVSVCPSVTFVSCVKTNKDIDFFSPSGSQAILVIPCQTGWRYSDGNPLNGASNAGGVGKKRDSERISLHTLRTCLQSYQPYESRSVKNKAATNVGKRRAEHSRRRPSPFFAQEDYEFVCDGLDVIRRRRRSTPPLSAAVGHRRTEPGWYFVEN